LKRAPFLGGASAVLLAGCGGHHVMRALPGVAPSSSTSSSKTNSQHGKLVPDVAEAIPDTVLTHPILGEARRFDGAVAPPGWMLAQGQALPIASNHPLFSVIGKIGGGDAATFKLTNPGFGVIIAVAGLLPTSPAMLAQSGRRMTRAASAVEGATLPPIRDPRKTAMDRSIAARRVINAAIRVGRASPPVPREVLTRMRQTRVDSRTEALAALSPSSRGRLDAGIQAAMAGRADVYGAVTEMAATLTNGEANALLQINAAMIRAYNDRWDGNPRGNAGLDAANFLLSVAITADQANAIALHER
jgi:hypothetical protein